jgi:hypothetical protein
MIDLRPSLIARISDALQGKDRQILVAAIAVIGISALASAHGDRGGDHGGNMGQYANGGSDHQSWCDINPRCNGWAAGLAAYTAYTAAMGRQSTQAPVLTAQTAFASVEYRAARARPVVAAHRAPVERPLQVAGHSAPVRTDLTLMDFLPFMH